MSDNNVKTSTFGRIRGDRPCERPDWSGTPSINEGRQYNVITPHGEIKSVVACSPALAIRLVTPKLAGVCVTEGPVVKCLGPCNRCGNPIWQGDRHKIDRKRGKIEGTWTRIILCEDCY